VCAGPAIVRVPPIEHRRVAFIPWRAEHRLASWSQDDLFPRWRETPRHELRSSSPADEVWAVVGGGAGGLNPVVVRVVADRLGEGGCRAVVRACAKEGLIKQRAAQKTAARVRDELAAEPRSRG